MATGPGLSGPHLAPKQDYYGCVSFWLTVQTVTGTSSYQLFKGGAPYAVRVIRVRGIMTAAGGAADTIVVKDNGAVAITDTISVAALSDKDTFEESSIDDAHWEIQKGQNLTVVTASDALAFVMVEVVKV